MSEEKITYEDVEEFEKIFKLVPSFLLERYAKKNTNIILKFESKVKSFLDDLNDNDKRRLNIVLNSDIDELQSVMADAYSRTNIKQYKILANPKYKPFVEVNLNEISRMIN